MSREVLQQALEALVTAEAGLADIGDADREPTDDLAWCEERAAQALAIPRAAITAIKEALAQPEQEPVGVEWTPCIKLPVVVHVRQQHLGETHVSTREGITPVRADDLIMRGVEGEEYPIGSVLFLKTYTFDTSQPEQEPVAWLSQGGDVSRSKLYFEEMGFKNLKPLVLQIEDGLGDVETVTVYTSPPKREWVGLTEWEREAIALECGAMWPAGALVFMEAVEMALKEKNT